MKEISAEDFLRKIEENPSWCLSLKEETLVKGSLILKRSPIKALSALLHFVPSEEDKKKKPQFCFVFEDCPELEHIQGNFFGGVLFKRCGAKVLDKFWATAQENSHEAASFIQCENLKIFNAIVQGDLAIHSCGIEKLSSIEMDASPSPKTQRNGFHLHCLSIRNCPNLQTINIDVTASVIISENKSLKKVKIQFLQDDSYLDQDPLPFCDICLCENLTHLDLEGLAETHLDYLPSLQHLNINCDILNTLGHNLFSCPPIKNSPPQKTQDKPIDTIQYPHL